LALVNPKIFGLRIFCFNKKEMLKNGE